ncbi:MAG: S8 family serine peptidase [Muribaculaceae bacterium]|nr:S8 family serine peptidase [Muribaculaceae bacterium]
MRKTLTIVLISAAIGSASATDKLDAGSRARLRGITSGMMMTRDAQGHVKAPVRESTREKNNPLRAFITIAPGHDTAELAAAGVTINSSRGGSVLAEFDASLLPAVEAMDAVERITLESPVNLKMDRVRQLSHIDEIHSGTDLPQAYTGKGVVAGIVDGGFDPNHLNFLNSDGVSRISNFCYYRPTQSGEKVEQIVGPDIIPEIDTESDETFHGTHTLGIMAGGYRGKINMAVRNGLSSTVKEVDNPYYGIAYDSDIALASGASSDYYVAMGIETILNYAYYKKEPAVINLSLGSNVGPHDGTSALCQYIDKISALDRVVVCIAAGNEGNLPIAITKTMTEDDRTLRSCFTLSEPVEEYPNVRAGQTYVYSDTKDQFDIQAVVVNRSRGAVAMRMPLPATDGNAKYWVTEAGYQSDESDVISPQLAKWFNGYVGIGAQYESASGRYYAVIDCMLWDKTTGSNADGNYVLGFEITGKAGQRIDVYGDGQFNGLSSLGMEGFTDGGYDGTINDLATGNDIVVVGSYNVREQWTSLDGGVYGYEAGAVPTGEISAFSSYGTLIDGRTLPTVCAPGATVISSSNEYFLQAAGAGKDYIQADYTANGRHYSWHQCVGTSMATPVVSGAIALWLEADPTLTASEINDIISETSLKDDAVSNTGNPVQWGAGKFDALAGLKEVIRRNGSGICGPANDDSRLLVTPLGNGLYDIYLDGTVDLRVNLYTPAGIKVCSVSGSGSGCTIDTSSLQPGIYLVNVNGTHTQRIAVK